MGDGNTCSEARERTAECAGRIALDDQQIRSLAQQSK
jgi:hypothetical protein